MPVVLGNVTVQPGDVVCADDDGVVVVPQAAEAEVRRLGLYGIGLHVFGHNSGARLLYERLGYRTTNINMFKSL